MMKFFQRFILLGIGGVWSFTYTLLHASPVLKEGDFEYLLSRQVALYSRNAAFLPTLHVKEISRMEIFLEKGNGDFLAYNQSGDALSYCIGAESYYRFNERIMLYGNINYTNFMGKQMEGSAFINPAITPFDIVEADNGSKGTKKMETYCLEGGLGYRLNERWILGGDVRYQTGNYAKYKDLRHKNSLMDMDISLGTAWNWKDRYILGGSYLYHRRNEAVSFATYGNKDIQYHSLISFGSFWGRKEAFGESGYTSKGGSRRTPLFEERHGGAIQFQLNFSKQIQWFNEVYIQVLDGRFGTGQDNMITYTHHDGKVIGFQSKLLGENSFSGIHLMELSAENRILKNYENSFKESTDASNVTQIDYYGSNLVLDRREQEVAFTYTYYHGFVAGHPVWKAGLKMDFYHRSNQGVVYPFYQNQDITSFDLRGEGERKWQLPSGVYGVQIGVGYGQGGGGLIEEGILADPGSEQQSPFMRSDLLELEYEYFTSPKMMIGLDLGYERQLRPGLRGYIKASYDCTQAFQVKVNGRFFHHFQMVIGCQF